MPFMGLMLFNFFQRQKVGVRVHADTWVVGIVVGIVHLASMVTHLTMHRTSKFN